MNIFFIGVGGVSMSGLAHIAINQGHNVYGSDVCISSKSVRKLIKEGAIVYKGHSKEHITDNIDLVVYTSAIKEDNEEFKEAVHKGIPMQSRAVFLGKLMDCYSNSIAISGTHGKTSTTSMVSTVFKFGDADPTILVGGNLNFIDGNVHIGNSENFITEACEYTNSFLNFNPNIGIVLNIEADHLDYFSGLDEIIESFNLFGKNINKNGYFIINGDDENTKTIDDGVLATTIRFGKNKDNDVVIDIKGYNEKGFATFELVYDGLSLGEFELNVPGEHNVYNATSAILASYFSNLNIDDIRTNISMYSGVGRRFEHKGYFNDAVQIIDDYAHHPTEIKATLKALKNMSKGNVWVIFQPHTYSRTKTLLKEFSKAFGNADKIIIADIYASREKFTSEISSGMLANEISKYLDGLNKEVYYINNFKDIAEKIKTSAKANDVVLTMGAGDVYKIADLILK